MPKSVLFGMPRRSMEMKVNGWQTRPVFLLFFCVLTCCQQKLNIYLSGHFIPGNEQNVNSPRVSGIILIVLAKYTRIYQPNTLGAYKTVMLSYNNTLLRSRRQTYGGSIWLKIKSSIDCTVYMTFMIVKENSIDRDKQ